MIIGLTEPEVLAVDPGRSGADRAIAVTGLLRGRVDGEPLDLPLGRRDALLVELRIQSFGPSVTAVARCRSCEAEIEAEIDLAALAALAPLDAITSVEVPTVDGPVAVRVPTTRDLVAAADATDVVAACADRPLNDEVRAAAEAAIDAADPLVDLGLELVCHRCDAVTARAFDIVAVLAADIDGYVERFVHDVARLAGSFGWSETDVLAVPPWRRSRYLAVAGS